ncbi:cellulose synthase complex periplasmic endoglucanase BcsZ [Oceanisphaera sp. KMM 10153]|uniref:cellulose synthase complex periplasmic endoglucanase BcsZ n=1 Tax=Oceanisphaera submarina TaxID=3390193 RepID=UPI003976C7F3
MSGMMAGMLSLVLLWSGSTLAACDWPAWQHFRQAYISEQGRVIDPAGGRDITTSEGQSYGMFFALVADDRDTFAQLLQWTQNNLAAGDMTARLPAWLWGQDQQQQWGVLDPNSAADSDLWLAYDLLEAGRLWHNRRYLMLGTLLLQRIAREEVANIPGLGVMLLPGKNGFVEEQRWTLNPSYLPPQLLARFAAFEGPWLAMRHSNQRLLLEAAPSGLLPDWVVWQPKEGWLPDPKTGSIGSYDAIRSYLWVGMLADDATDRASLTAHLQPMVELTATLGVPPERVDVLTGKAFGSGSVGFSAALLPLLQQTSAAEVQRRRLAAQPVGEQSYYDAVLTLFGQGWDQRRYAFNQAGELVPGWGNSCSSYR